MPIEDVDYLKEHSIRQSFVFLVDSSDRDKFVYPTPAEYVVNFTFPFRNVIGLEVLYASIPRTMYNVDRINNKLVFNIGFSANSSKTVVIPPGEYTIDTLLVVLNTLLHMHVDNDPSQPYIYITAESTTNPPDIEGKIQFRCSYPFWLDMGASTIAETLGFDELSQPSEALQPIANQRYTYDDTNRKMFKSVYMDKEIVPPSKVRTTTVFEGPRGVITNIRLMETIKVAQRFTPKVRGYLTKVYAALYSPSDTSSIVQWEVRTSLSSTSTPLVSGQIAVSYVDGTLNDSNDITSNYVFEANQQYWMVFKYGTGDPYLYYNDVLVTDDVMMVQDSDVSSDAWTSLYDNEIYYNASIRIDMTERFNYIEAPGMFVLTGPKYVILRCPEIENNSFRSLAYTKHNTGLGMFRLGIVGYSDNRLDFNKVSLREFHPIGKLSRMTLRLELPNGELYDFKGVNHTITFSISYLEPIQKQQFKSSILNPNYDGNFISYMYRQEEQESDSDDQEEDFSRDAMANYRIQEQHHLPASVQRRDREFGIFNEDDDS